MATDPPRPATGAVRVLIVDDSALIRKVLTEILRGATGIQVVGAAPDAESALDMARTLRPDVVTLDIRMPGRSGLEILPILVSEYALPVVMVSTLTQAGAEETLAALELGAVDFMAKPERHSIAQLQLGRDTLVEKIRCAAQSRVRGRVPNPSAPHRAAAQPTPSGTGGPCGSKPAEGPRGHACVVIGISTGGPEALSQTLPMLAPPVPPIVIVQHMPAAFTAVFAQRLARRCLVPVKEAAHGDPVESDQILVTPGGRHTLISGHPPRCTVALTDGPTVSGHRPSIDMLFQSAASAYGAATVGILMTGMGRDGVEGLKRILAAGGTTFGQDEATSVVYGMNKAAMVEGAVRAQFPLEGLPALIERFVGRHG